MTDSLEQFIKGKLTAEQFDRLATLLQITQTKLTRILNKPTEATLAQVLDLAALLRVEASTLVHHFDMGFDNITLSENSEIIEKRPKVAI